MRFPRGLTAVAALLCVAATSLAQERIPLAPVAGVLPEGAQAQLVRDGFDGTEGPVPQPDGGVLFTENRAGRIIRIAPDGSTAVFLEQTNGSNALAVAPNGELVAAQTAQPRVGIVYPAAAARTLVAAHEGKPFGRPNDLIVSRGGHVYFTDPAVAPAGEPPRSGTVYHLTPDGRLAAFGGDIERPNGVALAPDEAVLYVANTQGEWVFAYDLGRDGKPGKRRPFAKTVGVTPGEDGRLAGGADGLAVDAQGRLYVATRAGVQVFDRKGQALGLIELPKSPQNLAFAGPARDVLYVVGRGAVYRIPTTTRGPDRPGK